MRIRKSDWFRHEELLALGVFGPKSRLGDRIETLLRRGREFSPRASMGRVVASAVVLLMFLIAGSFAPRWIAFAQPEPLPSFEVASVKPSNLADRRPLFRIQPGGRLTVANFTVLMLIRQAYRIKQFQISGGPSWMNSDLFNITAKAAGPVNGTEQLMPMLQSLLAERFRLVIRHGMKEMPVYALAVDKNGPKFKEAKETDPNIIDLGGRGNPAGRSRPSVTRIRRGLLVAQETNMKTLADQLSNFLGRDVVDKTGLTGKYDLKLEWVPDENQVAMFQAMRVPEGLGAPATDWQGPSLFVALQEQLGLKLESQKGPVEMLVIERVEKPSAN